MVAAFPPGSNLNPSNNSKGIAMNVIIEPLSAQAWARVEARIMDRLANEPLEEAGAPRPHELRLCKLASTLLSARRRFTSWIPLHVGRAAGSDAAPESRVGRSWRAIDAEREKGFIEG
jgi:hypothetical protein